MKLEVKTGENHRAKEMKRKEPESSLTAYLHNITLNALH